MIATEFVTDREIYERVIRDAVPGAQQFLWIGTADIKDLYVEKGREMVPFLEILSDLIGRGVSVRLIHAKEPGPAFREDFDRYPNLFNGLERVLCPRVHFKTVVVDGRFAYSGSANLTGAGIGCKGDHRRNFEAGIVTTDPLLLGPIMEQFDSIWMGARCQKCQRKEYCTEKELMG
jgi:phosphatidylserine/phosphatidylglycerophosphate/cardiolipin synthase-like enzyme